MRLVVSWIAPWIKSLFYILEKKGQVFAAAIDVLWLASQPGAEASMSLLAATTGMRAVDRHHRVKVDLENVIPRLLWLLACACRLNQKLWSIRCEFQSIEDCDSDVRPNRWTSLSKLERPLNHSIGFISERILRWNHSTFCDFAFGSINVDNCNHFNALYTGWEPCILHVILHTVLTELDSSKLESKAQVPLQSFSFLNKLSWGFPESGAPLGWSRLKYFVNIQRGVARTPCWDWHLVSCENDSIIRLPDWCNQLKSRSIFTWPEFRIARKVTRMKHGIKVVPCKGMSSTPSLPLLRKDKWKSFTTSCHARHPAYNVLFTVKTIWAFWVSESFEDSAEGQRSLELIHYKCINSSLHNCRQSVSSPNETRMRPKAPWGHRNVHGTS